MSYNPFTAIQHLLETSAGLHALQNDMPLNTNLHLQKAHTALEEASQTWVNDLYLRLCKQPSTQSKKDFYFDTVSKIIIAYNALSEIESSDTEKIIPLLTFLKESQEAIQYYIDHNDEIISEQRTNPDIKAKVIAYFGDMLVA